MRLSHRSLILSASLLLAACGTMAEGQTQMITLRTPGASEAKCVLDNGVRYTIRKDETIQVMRSFHALELDCYAIGNRHKKMRIPAGGNYWIMGNVANAGVGAAYDAASGGFYAYPDVITVDFSGEPARGFELPDYHNRDAVNPYEQSIENMGPSTLRGPMGAKSYLPRGLEKRDVLMDGNPFVGSDTKSSGGADSSGAAGTGAGSASSSQGASSSKAPAVPSGSSAEELTRSANPSVFNQ